MTVQDIVDEYFTEEEVCKLLSPGKPLARETLQVRRSRGENHPPYIKLGQTILYPKSEFYKWLKSQPIKRELRGTYLHSVK